MANTFIKAAQIADASTLLLEREIVLPRLVWTQPSADFVGALNDTITLRVPAKRTGRTRVMRSNTALVADDLTETSVPVTLDTHAYDLLNITDEQLTLDIRDFARQVLQPQMRAVAEQMEDTIASALSGATVDASQTIEVNTGTDDPYDVLVDARKVLNDLNVPRSERVLVLGSALEAWFLKSEKVINADYNNGNAVQEAVIGRMAGVTVVGSNAIGESEGYLMHRTAIAFGNVAPALPQGAAMAARTATENIALRYLRDYDPTNSTGPVDRSLVDAFIGATSVETGGNNDRMVKLVDLV